MRFSGRAGACLTAAILSAIAAGPADADGESREVVRLPREDLFAPPLADLKQPRSHLTWQKYHLEFGDFDIASVGFGDYLGFARWPGKGTGEGWQVGLNGSVFAIFNLDSDSHDLINADYVVGFPASFRAGAWSARARLYHLSSHLGDELLLNPQPLSPPKRINLSYEAIELIAARQWGGWRAYAGGVHILLSDTPLRRNRVQVGFDYEGGSFLGGAASFVAGADVEAWNETNWSREVSLKAGILLKSTDVAGRPLQILAEYYHGHVPHGQFFENVKVEYFGLGISLQP